MPSKALRGGLYWIWAHARLHLWGPYPGKAHPLGFYPTHRNTIVPSSNLLQLHCEVVKGSHRCSLLIIKTVCQPLSFLLITLLYKGIQFVIDF